MPSFRTASFWIKLGLAAGVVALADVLLYMHPLGANLGGFAAAVIAAAFLAHPPLRRVRLSRLALLGALALAALQVERATALGLALFCVAIGVAVLAPRAAGGDDAWRWFQRLAAAALKSTIGPLKDFSGLLKVRARRHPLRLSAVLVAAILPVAGGIVFLSLFIAANPVISQAIDNLHVAAPDFARLIFWGAIGGAAWAVLRPRGLRASPKPWKLSLDADVPGVSPASVTASLLVFNAVFALENGLDVAFLWSGAPLPKGVTLADYVHRGAYPLIITALLAGLFVLVYLRPGSQTAARRWPRVLVTAWVAQNLLLVASTALRTLRYVEVYSLTRLRIAALIWMALVAVGLALICWRLLRAKSASWLINANVLAAGVVLAACSVADLGSIAASWNVRHAAEAGGGGQALDLCYLSKLNGDAVVSLAELERRQLAPDFRERVTWERQLLTAEVEKRQSNWRGWRWRDARRLDRVRTLVGPNLPQAADWRRGDRMCDGSPRPPSRPAPPPAQLTAPSQPRT
jgi:hypothetical protein